MITRGTTNTRLRDFYDLYALLETKKAGFNNDLLQKAFLSTANHRGSEGLLKDGEAILNEVFQSDYMEKLWTRYQQQYPYATDINWKAIENAVLRLWKMSIQ